MLLTVDFETEYKLMSGSFKVLLDKAYASPHALIDLDTIDFKYTPLNSRAELNELCGNKLWGEMYIAIRPSKTGSVEFCYHGHNIQATGHILNSFAVFDWVDNDFYYKKTERELINWELLKKEQDEIMCILRSKANAS